MTFERQKMSVEMWEKLKSHIMKQREKRKQGMLDLVISKFNFELIID